MSVSTLFLINREIQALWSQNHETLEITTIHCHAVRKQSRHCAITRDKNEESTQKGTQPLLCVVFTYISDHSGPTFSPIFLLVVYTSHDLMLKGNGRKGGHRQKRTERASEPSFFAFCCIYIQYVYTPRRHVLCTRYK